MAQLSPGATTTVVSRRTLQQGQAATELLEGIDTSIFVALYARCFTEAPGQNAQVAATLTAEASFDDGGTIPYWIVASGPLDIGYAETDRMISDQRGGHYASAGMVGFDPHYIGADSYRIHIESRTDVDIEIIGIAHA